ncbi:B3 domain-containing protein Os01g0234100-like isoform X2 [Rhodamnia argentea]|uniref:B3 domain-containing protein Os01g0234100-like isoform X2 n=1 Tax=Rhodamnia argentea TaxID=178133 RepID=A0ABM3HHC1_9MYRT|nr:B3 domain-containing protein Os01g0234100-like isoform X2 [Rhodamnia argentea]
MAAGQVKTEMQDEGPPTTTPAPEQPRNLKPSAEGGVTLALLSPTPASKAKSEVKVRKRKGTILKIKVKDSGSQVVSDGTRKSLSFKRSKTALDGLDPSEVKSGAMVRAEEVQSNLEPTYPSFIKALVRSHVGSCFWMGLPGVFCRAHLPNRDTTIILEDEHGKQYEMKYIAHKTGLSAGWRQFSVGHNLLEGDVLVFQLVEPNKFKVYIIKAGDLSEVDGALGLLNLDAPTKKVEAEDGTNPEASSRQTKRKRGSSLPLAIVQKRKKRSYQRKSTPNPECLAEQSENDSEGVNSEVLEGFKLSLPDVQFKDVDTFSNFHIVIDGMVVNSELSEDILRKYYELCCSQNVFLHDNLIKGMNYKLIVGAICETVNIADAVRACKLTTTREEFETWDKTLKALKILGMNVGFLRARLKRLVELAFESEMATETRRYVESKIKRDCADEEIRNLEMRILELKEENRRVGVEIECLKPNVESYELKFQEEVTAPW